MQPILIRITVYPIKSLDGHRLQKVTITGGGSLAHDREFALVDDAGRYINGKRTSRVHHLRTSADLSSGVINLSAGEKCVRFDVEGKTVETEEWLGSFFGHRISLRHDSLTGFPDDTNANGPTLVSTATIEEVASWFSGLNADEVRRRFRPNLEISGVPAFWEDRLFAGRSEVVRFTIGPVSFEGTNPCARCVVPTRNPETGSPYTDFQQEFMRKRRELLPLWTNPSRFNHFYRMCVNTRIDRKDAGKILQCGDELKLLG